MCPTHSTTGLLAVKTFVVSSNLDSTFRLPEGLGRIWAGGERLRGA